MSRQFERELRQCGARLIRTNKHRVYQLPNGRLLVTSHSPSDFHAENQIRRQLRRLLQDTASI